MAKRRIVLVALAGLLAGAGCSGSIDGSRSAPEGDHVSGPPPLGAPSPGKGSPHGGGGPSPSDPGGPSAGSGGASGAPAPSLDPDGQLGVTPGGAKDIGYARDLIAKGQVPPSSAITVEGLMSEHDIPVEGEACQGLLCVRPALAVQPFLETGQREHFVQLGFLSGFDRKTFKRPPLDLVVLWDDSAAMESDQAETNVAVASIVDHMRPDDRLALMTFNDLVRTLAPFGPVTDAAALKARVMQVTASGGFNIETALRAAYDVLDRVPPSGERMRRLIVLSCGYPPISGSADDPMSALIMKESEQRIGLTFVGVLLGWERSLADLLGRARGGSYHYLQDLAAVERVFEGPDFDLEVTPLLSDFTLALKPGANFEVVKMYGVPGAGDGPAQMEAPGQAHTGGAFLSSRRGAIVAHLRRKAGTPPGGDVGTVSVRFETEPALNGGQSGVVDQEVAVPDGDGTSKGARKAVVLVNQALRMQAACDAYHAGKKQDADRILGDLLGYLRPEAMALGAADLDGEIKLVEALRVNVGK